VQKAEIRAYKFWVVQKITHEDHDSRKQFALEMLSCIEEDEFYLSRLCFSDKTTFHLFGSQQAQLSCMGE
jgi:hypothetical protein